MKVALSLIFVFFIYNFSNAQYKDSISSKRTELHCSVIIDNSANFSGGIKKGVLSSALFDFTLLYNPFSRRILKNTSFFSHILKTAGTGPSENLIGDLQVISNIDGTASRFLYEMLIIQKIGYFTIKAGLHDLNSEFMAGKYASDFINSSFGVMPILSLNTPVSIFPVTTFGGILSYEASKIEIALGIYNLNCDFPVEDHFDFNNHFCQRGYFHINEIRYRPFKSNAYTGEYKLGSYYYNCDTSNNIHTGEDYFTGKDLGIYFTGDQVLYKFESGNYIGAFLQLGFSGWKNVFATEYYGAGLSFNAESKKGILEQIGLAAGKVNFNPYFNVPVQMNSNHETVVEFTASFTVAGRIHIQPDLQYIINPSSLYNNAFAGILRFNIELI